MSSLSADGQTMAIGAQGRFGFLMERLATGHVRVYTWDGSLRGISIGR